MTKYETTIKVKAREKIPDLLTILEHLFFRRPENAKLAQTFIYKLIEKKRVPDSEWAATQKALGCSHQQYYTTLSKLRDCGMIAKANGDWIISEQFGNRTTEMADIWKSFVRRWETKPY